MGSTPRRVQVCPASSEVQTKVCHWKTPSPRGVSGGSSVRGGMARKPHVATSRPVASATMPGVVQMRCCGSGDRSTVT